MTTDLTGPQCVRVCVCVYRCGGVGRPGSGPGSRLASLVAADGGEASVS